MNVPDQSIRNLEPKQDIRTSFCSYDLDLGPMTLMYELDPDIPRITYVPNLCIRLLIN